MKRDTFTNNPGGTKPESRKGFPFPYGGLLILLATALFSGCSLSPKTSSEVVITGPSELTYSVSVSASPIQISSGNLHWHKELPNDSYTLEDMTLEIFNLGDFDISIAQLEVTAGEDTRLFNIDLVISGGTSESIALQPMMEGYDGGVHRIYIVLRDDNGGVLYQNGGEDIGPLEPEAGTGSWQLISS